MQKKQNNHLEQLSYIINNKDRHQKDLDVLSEGIENIFLIGCGATLSQMYVLEYLLDMYIDIPVRIMNSAEAYIRAPKSINKRSLVITSSHSGSTAETVKSAEMAKSRNAKVISITANKQSNLANASDVVLDYPSEGIAPSESKLLLLYIIGFKLFELFDIESDNLIKQWQEMPGVLWEVRDNSKKQAAEFAKKFASKKMFYIIGGGGAYGAAYAFSICKFMEMQWLDSTSLQCGEFFHGPLEKAENQTTYILLKTEDKTRELADRVEKFLLEHSDNVEIIDTREYDFGDINREVFSPIILWPIMNLFMEYFAEATGHDLDKRRYMGKVKY